MKILLATLHAKYVHASLALPCLAAACQDIHGCEIAIREFTIHETPDQLLRRLIAEEADLVGFSCYIWNIEATLRLADDLKKIRPETLIVIGGPETAESRELLERSLAVDLIIRGEGEATFHEVVATLAEDGMQADLSTIAGITLRRGDIIIATPDRPSIANLDTIPSPFAAGLVDASKPLVYYETSRGCPFSCAFCMSSLEKGVRSFSMERIESDLKLLIEREVQTVKLVDRTFNYDARRANDIWRFILHNNRKSRFHFEVAADLLTPENIELLREVPPDTFRFEIGVQSVQPEALGQMARKSDLERLFKNAGKLRQETNVTVHLDLVAGLPGEDYRGFLESLQQLFNVLDTKPISQKERATKGVVRENASHIQIEPLKVLKGSPMRDIAARLGYAFSAAPPYKILGTPWLTFADICRIETVSRLIDLYFNSGRFAASLAAISDSMPLEILFDRMAAAWEKDCPQHPTTDALFTWLHEFVTAEFPEKSESVSDALCYDYCVAECPVAGRLPSFFGDKLPGMTRVQVSEAMKKLGLVDTGRIRMARRSFLRDYRQFPWSRKPVELLFVHISAPGKGLHVRVIDTASLSEPIGQAPA